MKNLSDHTTAWMMAYAMVHPNTLWAGLNAVVDEDLDPAQWQALFMLFYETDSITPIRLSFETEAQTDWALEGLEKGGLVSITYDNPLGFQARLTSDGMSLMEDAGAAILKVCHIVEEGCKGSAYDFNQ